MCAAEMNITMPVNRGFMSPYTRWVTRDFPTWFFTRRYAALAVSTVNPLVSFFALPFAFKPTTTC
jgi:hypothetical protein